MPASEGFLVVLKNDPRLSNNPLYRGLFRMPTIPSLIPEEDFPLEQYVFGPFRDNDTDLIVTLESSRKLASFFRQSPREYEIILAVSCEVNKEDASATGYMFLGYDVAGRGGDFWSVVGDFPTECDELNQQFFPRLNRYGLLDTFESSIEYMTCFENCVAGTDGETAMTNYPEFCIYKVYFVEDVIKEES